MQGQWEALKDGRASSQVATLLLRVVASTAARFPPHKAAELVEDLLSVSARLRLLLLFIAGSLQSLDECQAPGIRVERRIRV